MRVTVVGTGYVGLVSGACFSEFGHHVTCVDKDPAKIDALNRGKIPIFEPGLEDLVARNVAAGRLDFAVDMAEAVADSEAVFIAVGTPSRRGDGHADLSYVRAAAAEIAAAVRGFTVVVTKSTVPVGTGLALEALLRETAPGADVEVASNPEFLREGSAIEDFMRPDRVVVGIQSDRAQAVMAGLYRPLSLNETPVLYCDRETAELIKYASNAFLATKIGFINEIADLCERVGGNVQDVARGMGLDKRIGPKFLHAGPGYGGSCFPKDTLALLRTAEQAGTPLRIVDAVVQANDTRKAAMADRIIAACGGSVAGKRIALLGLTFKPNTDDMRESPSLAIVPRLKDAGAEILAYDPEGMDEAAPLLGHALSFGADPYAVIDGADAVVILTEWNQFRALDLARVARLLRAPVMVDLRNVYGRGDEPRRHGLVYHGIGRGEHAADAPPTTMDTHRQAGQA
ncbi:UDP-glucose dehydrogenase [Rhodothalassium salexigens DSM 2132]|uniref:UDP-glucose 6-dehydrogenase n=1 Tax=Rhodothalassium salexigens DSM 2132 TaxID=1188247 RepID=A0A4R2PA69_RHOSA|nr:UDP-glucose/GDP-mannose dehydrogenase family protein [Rhodothalassium salexigens]MBB4212419.1 UDPglucose 6-dehydrogenase [Rhodothalassium salexigens DSM 2132]MBK1637840.1 UDP-glucose 6-dehydrogenase [Rhodothalassium salexigens DSM 2132]TCP31950.1 UDP-glucose dehydrogenase [Rhodothalassium salexigens DSM 2132]